MKLAATLLLAASFAAAGVSPDELEALSWNGRRALAEKHYTEALSNSDRVRALCLEALKHRPLDAEPHLPIALGASIEVRGQALAAEGHRGEALAFLTAEEARWKATSIRPRIRKNLNLLSLEGKPAPRLNAHPGHPVLMFFWAHWCADCKMEGPIVEQLQKIYGPKGLVVMAPTQTYGYVAGGAEAPPAVELRYIQEVRQHYYPSLARVEVPVDNENFAVYGVSTTPTLVLVDRKGIVRMYHPGAMTLDELSRRIEPLL